MIKFILNNQDIETDLSPGITVLDFARYRQNLKGTKIGCREGDCGACTVLVGELIDGKVRYRSMTSCLMPLANAAGKHIVTVEGINPADGSLTPVQQALVDESGTQCGFCTVGFVMSLTGFCLDSVSTPHVSKGSATPLESAVSAVDGNICRCTGYKSIERAAERVCERLAANNDQFVPEYFTNIPQRLDEISSAVKRAETRPSGSVPFVSGGTDVYVQKPDEIAEVESNHLFYDDDLRTIRQNGEFVEIGASVTVTDLLESELMQSIFPRLYEHLKLVSSTPIRNMATLAGNFVNASPIGDMTVWFLALDAEIVLRTNAQVSTSGSDRVLSLKDLYVGYKQLARSDDEYITSIRFRKPNGDFRFNFEKVCKRTYLDIATVNTAISMTVRAMPADEWVPPAISGSEGESGGVPANFTIIDAHVAAGGVSPIPLYLKKTSVYLRGREINQETIGAANEIMQSEISPISDVRGTESYKRLLLQQLFMAHFVELFDLH
jgi:xanthine dehydrogenase small subunit